jgi:succinyl-CoA synthetase beta subunit
VAGERVLEFDVPERSTRMFVEKDMSMLEINPLVVTKDGKLICLDAKFDFDNNALIATRKSWRCAISAKKTRQEIEASKFDLALSSSTARSAAWSTVRASPWRRWTSSSSTAEPANFLDVGGGASKEKVQEAFKIILADPNVMGILVNIFGGIMRCDIIAEGVIAAAREMAITVPLVVRLEGTNVELGKKILRESGLKIIPADDLADAAKKITDEVKKAA